MVRQQIVYREQNGYDFEATEVNWKSREQGIGTGHFIIPSIRNDFTEITDSGTGTCNTVNGTPIITGSGTSWESTIGVNDFFTVEGGVDAGTYTVVSVDSNTQITTNASPNFTGSTNQDWNNQMDYYRLQEEEIYIENELSEVVFRGRISNPQAVTGGYRIDFEDLPGIMKQRHNKRDYQLGKGVISYAATSYIIDETASFSTGQWNNYGVVLFPNPQVFTPEFVATWQNTQGIKMDTATKPYGYLGYGFGEKHDLLGTLASETDGRLEPTYGPDWCHSRTADYRKVCSVLQEDAVGSTSSETIRLRWNTNTDHSSHGVHKPGLDVYIPIGDVPPADLVGVRIRVQAAVRDAAQTSGIGIYWARITGTDPDETGDWEDLSAKAGAGYITQNIVDDDTAAYGVWDKSFELFGGGSSLIDLDGTDWDEYVYPWYQCETNPRTQTKTRTGKKKVIRLFIEGVDDCDEHSGWGMYVGSVKVWLFRQGTDTNQYKITNTVAPSRLTLSSDPSDYAARDDKYRIAPSLEIVWDDFDDATYGASDYPFAFSDTYLSGQTDWNGRFLGMRFKGQNHFDILQTLCDYGKHIWWYDPTVGLHGTLYVADDADRATSGLSLNATNIPPGAALLQYPQANIIGKVIAYGNDSLGITYVKTGTTDSTQEVVLNFPHVYSYAELQAFADALFDKWSERKPIFTVTTDYDIWGANRNKLRPGQTVSVTYKNLSAEVIPIRAVELKWTEGEKATITIECSEYGTPPEEKIGDTIAKLRGRVNRYIGEGLIEDNINPVQRQINQGRLSMIDDVSYISSDGNTPMDANWYTGDSIVVTTDELNLYNSSGTNPSLTGLVDAVRDVVVFSDEIEMVVGNLVNALGDNPIFDAAQDAAGATLDLLGDLDNATGGIFSTTMNWFNTGGTDSYAESAGGTDDQLNLSGWFQNLKTIFENPSGTNPEIYATDSASETEVYTPTKMYVGSDHYVDDYFYLGNADAGVDQTLNASGAAGEEIITASNHLSVNTGYFAANSVNIGDYWFEHNVDAFQLYDVADSTKYFELDPTRDYSTEDIPQFVLSAQEPALLLQDTSPEAPNGVVFVDTGRFFFRGAGAGYSASDFLCRMQYGDNTNQEVLWQVKEFVIDMQWTAQAETYTGLHITSTETLSDTLIGIDIDLDGVTHSNNDMVGLAVRMPATYGSGTEYGLQLTGDGRTVLMLTDSYAIHVDVGDVKFDGALTVDGGMTAAGGFIYAGASDTTRGELWLYGPSTGSDTGGLIRIYNSADQDTNIDYYRIITYQEDLYFSNNIPETYARIDDSANRWIFTNYAFPRCAGASDSVFEIWGNSSDNAYGSYGRSGAQEWSAGMKYNDDAFYILDGTISSTTGVRISTNSIAAASNTAHRILFDPTADELHLYPGDTGSYEHVRFYSGGTTNTNPRIQPAADQYGYVGTSALEWRYMYSLYIYRNGTALDEHDDLAIIDNIKVKKDKQGKIKRNEQGNPLVDETSLPDFLRANKKDPIYYEHQGKPVNDKQREKLENKSHIELGAWTDLAIGGVKQLHQKVKDQQAIIEELAIEVGKLKHN